MRLERGEFDAEEKFAIRASHDNRSPERVEEVAPKVA